MTLKNDESLQLNGNPLKKGPAVILSPTLPNMDLDLVKARKALKKIMADIKMYLENGSGPAPSALIGFAYSIISQFPELDNFKETIKELATQIEAKALTVSTSLYSEKSIYTRAEHQYLLEKENKYFTDEQNQKRFKFIDRAASGVRINDNDPTGKSITSAEFTEFLNGVTDETIKEKRNEAAEPLAYDAKKLEQKRKKKIPLTTAEVDREKEVKERISKMLYEELFAAKLNHHRSNIAEEEGKKPIDISTEHVVSQKGNVIIDEAIQSHEQINQKLTAAQIASLLRFDQEAFHRHHNNVDHLQAAAHAASQTQTEYEQNKARGAPIPRPKTLAASTSDFRRLKEKEKTGVSLSKEELKAKEETLDRVDSVLKTRILEATLGSQGSGTAREDEQLRDDEASVKASDIAARIKESFKGSEDKLADLVLHNPDAIAQHLQDTDRLRMESEAVQVQQIVQEAAKAAEDIVQTEVEKVSRFTQDTGTEEQSAEVKEADGSGREKFEESLADKKKAFLAKAAAKKKSPVISNSGSPNTPNITPRARSDDDDRHR